MSNLTTIMFKKMFKMIVLMALRKRKLVFLLFIITVIFIMLDYKRILVIDYSLMWGSTDNVTCYDVYENDALPSVEEENFVSDNSIFFHETSCKGNLNSRQACAVESAARNHPDRQIYVLFTGSVTREAIYNGTMSELRKISNIKFARVNLVQYAKGTPLQELIESGALKKSRWPISHTSDVMRYLTLFKWPGIYLDLDVVVAKPLTDLAKSFAGKECKNEIAAGVLAFSEDKTGRTFAETSIRDLSHNFKGDVWSWNGPGTIQRTLEKLCNIPEYTVLSAETCQGFEVYDEIYFYPIGYQYAYKYVEPGDIPTEDAYVYHVWNRFTKKSNVHTDSPYAKLARKHCPSIYSIYGDKFGL